MASPGILIVQDDFVEAERLRLLLALQLAGYYRPTLAIVDMMLEIDVDGIHTATALTRQFALKILITTGFPDAVIEAEGVPDLACAIVKKPYGEAEILAAVALCLA